jgi:exodeoxyribonuclease V alpha subunit
MTQTASLTSVLESDVFNSTDRHLAKLLLKLSGKECPALGLAAALVSRQLADGHSCISLDAFGGQSFPGSREGNGHFICCPARAEWERLLRETSVVGSPGEDRPLILDEVGRLYLQRYWRYEQAVAQDILARLQMDALAPALPTLATGMKRLFPATPGQTNWQQVAAFAAVRQRFSIITGGPGTGKTWTVARFLALLLEQPGSENLRVKLAAPTGKAAARLQESLAQSLESLACSDAIKTRLQAKDLTTTIHRLLGPIPNSASFRHGPDNPLPVDVLVVDEASMVSLSLMARLLAALKKEDVRLVLVGDKDQLPPVDPGGVLGDICRAVAANSFNPSFCKTYQTCNGGDLPSNGTVLNGELADTVVQLHVNYRSGEALALHTLSTAVNAGASSEVLKLLQNAGADSSALAWQTLPHRQQLKNVLRGAVRLYYRPVLEAASPKEALEALGRFRILCAVREGPFGTLAINRVVEEILGEELPPLAEKIRFGSYPGKPVMVTSNNYTLKLFNGDTGVFWTRNSASSLAHFPDENGSTRAIARERLPENETVYAMTVHKSQGSEFEHVLLVLPEKANPVLTRELFYTGLTRAKKSVRILSNEAVLRSAIETRAQRFSGLTDALCFNSHVPLLRESPLIAETGVPTLILEQAVVPSTHPKPS